MGRGSNTPRAVLFGSNQIPKRDISIEFPPADQKFIDSAGAIFEAVSEYLEHTPEADFEILSVRERMLGLKSDLQKNLDSIKRAKRLKEIQPFAIALKDMLSECDDLFFPYNDYSDAIRESIRESVQLILDRENLSTSFGSTRKEEIVITESKEMELIDIQSDPDGEPILIDSTDFMNLADEEYGEGSVSADRFNHKFIDPLIELGYVFTESDEYTGDITYFPTEGLKEFYRDNRLFLNQ